jgi:hypothetical protein
MKKVFFMSKVLSFITIFSLIITFYGFSPQTARAVTNPTLGDSCGIDMVLIMDTSISITGTGMTGDLGQMKKSFDKFVDSLLPSTPAKIAVVSFDDSAVLQHPFDSDPTLIKNAINGIDGDGYTNWESAIAKAHSQFTNDGKPHLIVFTSDGNPTASSKGPGDLNQPNVHLQPAIDQAISAWSDGIRIITLGIGTDINIANLQVISSADASFTTTNFTTLGDDLQGIVTNLCGGSIITIKMIDTDGDLTTTADQIPGEGWNFNIAGVLATTNNDGKTDAISVVKKAGPFDVTEISQPGYVPIYVSCVNTTTGASVGIAELQDMVTGINLSNDDIISCIFYSKPGIPPTGTLSAEDCEIALDKNSCDTTFVWNTINPVNTSAITTQTNITVTTGNSGAGKTYTIAFGDRTFYLYNNSTLLAQATVTASCALGTAWDNTKCAKVIVTSGTLDVDPGSGGNGNGNGNGDGSGLNVDSCMIKIGESTCKTTLVINIENPVPGAETNITKAGNVEVARGLNPAVKPGIIVDYPGTTFFLNHNGKTLASKTVNAFCEAGSSWDGTKCAETVVDGYWRENCGECDQTFCKQQCTRVCIPPRGGGEDCPGKGLRKENYSISCTLGSCGGNGELNINFSAAPTKIFKGKSTTLTWSSSGDSCIGSTNNAEVFNTGGSASGSVIVTPKTTTTYTITCTDKERGGISEVKEVMIRVDNLTIIER